MDAKVGSRSAATAAGGKLDVLALDPYHTGSHRQFVLDWAEQSRHRLRVMGLPGRHFKWRIRSAAVSFAERIRAEGIGVERRRPDLIWTTSLLNAAELRGLLPAELRAVPLVVYFHENQLEYPVRQEDPRDIHFAVTNWASALAADSVWFNSEYNRSTFLRGMAALLRKMPDERLEGSVAQIAAKSQVVPPGIRAGGSGPDRDTPRRQVQAPEPLHLLWVGRWEHDKNPEEFVSALRLLATRRIPFRLSILGKRFRERPEALAAVESEFRSALVLSRYVESRVEYEAVLRNADVVVSTARHEFFGVAVLEAVAAGCVPAVPARLVYPELYPPEFLYGQTPEQLALHLMGLGELKRREGTLRSLLAQSSLPSLTARLCWSRHARTIDDALLRAHGQLPALS